MCIDMLDEGTECRDVSCIVEDGSEGPSPRRPLSPRTAGMDAKSKS